MAITQTDLVMMYFQKHPKRDIAHPEIVDWLTQEYEKHTGKKFRDPDRAIRKLHQQGRLIKVAKGVYRYDPDVVAERELEDFTPAQKKQILERDGYRCVLCGRGEAEGVELHVDHIKPRELGGKATIANGQTLCAQHNFIKKTLKQTETGKRFFISLYRQAQEAGDDALASFAEDILNVYNKHDMNGHIVWDEDDDQT